MNNTNRTKYTVTTALGEVTVTEADYADHITLQAWAPYRRVVRVVFPLPTITSVSERINIAVEKAVLAPKYVAHVKAPKRVETPVYGDGIAHTWAA